MIEEIKIGTTLWEFDENRRVYRDKSYGGGGIIYRGHFKEMRIYDQTHGTWLVESLTGGHRGSINKKTLREPSKGGRPGNQYYTPQAMEDQVWLHDHRHKVIDALRNAPADVCRQVAELLGYDPGRP